MLIWVCNFDVEILSSNWLNTLIASVKLCNFIRDLPTLYNQIPWFISGCYLVDIVSCNWLDVACFLLLFVLFLALLFPPINTEISSSLCPWCWLCLNIDESDKLAKWLNCDYKFLVCLTLFTPEIIVLLLVWLSNFYGIKYFLFECLSFHE